MTQSLFDRTGNRKYLVAKERLAFARAACAEGGDVGRFCLTLAFTGARISEALSLTGDRIDTANGAIVFRTLKQRKKVVFRAVPVPPRLLRLLMCDGAVSSDRLWPWCRTAAWKYVKIVMRSAGICDGLCQPKALRHAYAIEAGQKGVPLNIVQRWLGHSRLETTAIYVNALGEEEKTLAQMVWRSLDEVISNEWHF